MTILEFSGERIVPEAKNCEPNFADKMYQEHVARYLFAAQWVREKRVLDVGCGVGYGSRLLAEQGAASVTAFDISSEAVVHARRFYGHPAVRFHVSSAVEFGFKERFDVVTCFELIEHVEDQEAVIDRIFEAMDDDGILIISTPRALESKRSEFHTREFSHERFDALLRRRFTAIQWYFENNHFVSLIANSRPSVLSNIHAIKDQFTLDKADYFIAVAAKNAEAMYHAISPVVVLNDDNYVTLMERDIEILRRSERNLCAAVEQANNKAIALTERFDQERQQCDKLKMELIAAQRDSERVTDELRVELQNKEALATELALARKELNLISNSFNEAQARLTELSKELDQARHQMQQIASAPQEFHSHSRRLASELGEMKNEPLTTTQIVATTCERCKKLSMELAQTRNQLEFVTTVVEGMKSSGSWRVTAPYRLLGGRFKQSFRMFRKARDYQRQHGTRALVGAVHRKLMYGGTPVRGPLEDRKLGELSNKAPLTAMVFDIIMVIGCWDGESKRYRVHNVAEGLEALGYRVHVITLAQIREVYEQGWMAQVLVLFRAPYDQMLGITEVIGYTRRYGIKVVFDVDDLVFEPNVIDTIDGVRLLSPSERNQYIDGVIKYREMLLHADLVTVPTAFLASRVQNLGKPCMVVPNSLNFEQLRIAEEMACAPKVQSDQLLIGYFSGSRTHQKDFAQCESTLLELMERHPNVMLRIVGYLALDERWNKYASRIERIDFQPWQVMTRLLAQVDINIAPLEIDNAFCQSKSELKFFEAGILGIPTVASATEPFLQAIDNGVNGFCVRNDREWIDALERLVTSADLRSRIGIAARERASERFGIQRVARLAAQAYGLPIKNEVRSGATPGGQTENTEFLGIAWVIPGLIIGGGGHRNILRAAYFLQQFGHRIMLYFTGTEKNPEDLKRLINDHFYPLNCPVYLYEGHIKSADVVFATHWTTVDAALRGRNVVREVMYFVQDFEPMFAPMSSEYVLAENTYRLGLYHITSGPWCEMVLRREFGAAADHFLFPVDRDIYYPRPRTYSGKRLLFFAKPEMPRRCFELGVMALRHFHRLRPDYEIVMFGSAHAAKQKYDFPVTFLDIVPTLDDLAQLYSNADAGMVFSTTNPSLVPYEMMACGLPVVDLRRSGNEINYGGRFDIALLANPQPEKLAEEVVELLSNTGTLKARSQAGLEFVDKFPSEEEMARRIEYLITRRLNKYQLGGGRGSDCSPELACPTCGKNGAFVPFLVRSRKNIRIQLGTCLGCTSVVNLTDLLVAKARNDYQHVQRESSADFYRVNQALLDDCDRHVANAIPVMEYLRSKCPQLVEGENDGVFVDYGAGMGFLALAASRFFSKVYAVELSKGPINEILTHQGAQGIITVVDDVAEVREPLAVVCMWHVLEHLPDAYCKVREIYQRLGLGGYLYFQVPMLKPDYIVETHYHFMNEYSAEAMCKQAGFSLIDIVFDEENFFMTVIACK